MDRQRSVLFFFPVEDRGEVTLHGPTQLNWPAVYCHTSTQQSYTMTYRRQVKAIEQSASHTQVEPDTSRTRHMKENDIDIELVTPGISVGVYLHIAGMNASPAAMLQSYILLQPGLRSSRCSESNCSVLQSRTCPVYGPLDPTPEVQSESRTRGPFLPLARLQAFCQELHG